MPLRYGLDVLTPTNQRDDDPWKPVMKNKVARQMYDTAEELIIAIDAIKAGNPQLQVRAVEINDLSPTYSL